MTDPPGEPPSEVAPGVHRIPLPFPKRPGVRLRTVNVHLVRRGDAYVLIDSGMGTTESFDVLVAAVRSLGVDPQQVSTLLVTHIHPDHYGSSQRWRELSGARVLLHARDAQFMMHLLLLTPTDYALFRKRHGLPERGSDNPDESRRSMRDVFGPAAPDATLRDDETLVLGGDEAASADAGAVRAMLTAGHTPGHVVGYLSDLEVLVSGDHLLPRITPHIGLGPDGLGGEDAGDPLGDYIDSLERVRGLRVKVVCPAHGPVFGNHAHRVQQIIDHHRFRLRAALDAVSRRPRTAWEVCTAIFGRLEDSQHDAATMETLAHLRHLERTSRVVTVDGDAPVRWEATRD
jgi:glyoxylase-like metal-dependent hydrolase (beta-lactamase superfamily II)